MGSYILKSALFFLFTFPALLCTNPSIHLSESYNLFRIVDLAVEYTGSDETVKLGSHGRQEEGRTNEHRDVTNFLVSHVKQA